MKIWDVRSQLFGDASPLGGHLRMIGYAPLSYTHLSYDSLPRFMVVWIRFIKSYYDVFTKEFNNLLQFVTHN